MNRYLVSFMLVLIIAFSFSGTKEIVVKGVGYDVSPSQYKYINEKMTEYVEFCETISTTEEELAQCINRSHSMLMEDMGVPKHPDEIIIIWW